MAPTIHDLRAAFDPDAAGEALHAFMRELYPICRSITGPGLRQTLSALRRRLSDLEVQGIPSGSRAFDWTVPPEWRIREAWIKGPDGRRVVDFNECNLHVVNYSEPVRRTLSLDELRPHLHSLPDHPGWIPYRTTYYRRDWGFCLRHDQLRDLPPGQYEVCIDSDLDDNGRLEWGELSIPGRTDREVLISTHCCHPSLCNDNLSGVVVAAALAELVQRAAGRRYSYRFLFIPGGIGSVVWLSRNADRVGAIAHGLVLNCLGDPGGFTYKLSRRADAAVDAAARCVLRDHGAPHRVIDFSPYGYDERNFCSAKFDLPVGSLTRSTHSRFPGYHSSGDDLDLVRPAALGESLQVYLHLIDVLERDRRYRNLIPEVEPQLGKRGLYGLQGGLQRRERMEVAMLWVMNQSDGDHGLVDIARRSEIPFDVVADAADRLLEHELLAPID